MAIEWKRSAVSIRRMMCVDKSKSFSQLNLLSFCTKCGKLEFLAKHRLHRLPLAFSHSKNKNEIKKNQKPWKQIQPSTRRELKNALFFSFFFIFQEQARWLVFITRSRRQTASRAGGTCQQAPGLGSFHSINWVKNLHLVKRNAFGFGSVCVWGWGGVGGSPYSSLPKKRRRKQTRLLRKVSFL